MSELSEITEMTEVSNTLEYPVEKENHTQEVVQNESDDTSDQNEIGINNIAQRYTARVNESISFGRYPYPPQEIVSQLEKNGFQIFIDLTVDEDKLPPYHKYLSKQSTYIHIPFPKDKDMMKDVQFQQHMKSSLEKLVSSHQESNTQIYIHDRGGHDRAPAVAAALLMMIEGKESKEALNDIMNAHAQRKNMKKVWREKGAPRNEYRAFPNILKNVKNFTREKSTVSEKHKNIHTGSFSINTNKQDDWDRMVEQGKELLLTMKDFGMLDISDDTSQFGKHVQNFIAKIGDNDSEKEFNNTKVVDSSPPDSEVGNVKIKKKKQKKKKQKKEKKKNGGKEENLYATDKKGFVKLEFR